MKEIWAVILGSWKTSLGGLLLFVATTLQLAGKISPEIFATIVAILTGLGFIVAKDGNKTGK